MPCLFAAHAICVRLLHVLTVIGTDIRNMTPIMTETLLNKDVITIQQDYTAKPGDQLAMCGGTTAWVRYLSDKRVAVGLPNLGTASASMDVCFSSLNINPKGVKVYDVWKKKDLGAVDDKYSATVDVHDTLLLLLTPAA